MAPPACRPWPMILIPQCSQAGASAWIAHSNESKVPDPRPGTSTVKAASESLPQTSQVGMQRRYPERPGGMRGGGARRKIRLMTDIAVSPSAAVDQWLASFDEALTAGDPAAAAQLFLEDSYWRDLVAFTWNIKTVEGRDGVEAMLGATLAGAKPRNWRVTEPPDEADGVVTAWLEFETEAGRGNGLVRLKDGKAWTLLTALYELKGHEEPKGPGRSKGVEHHAEKGRETWLEARRREAEELGHETQPEVVIIGGGQGGIALGARLRQLGVPTIIVERNERPGDSWRKRYKSLCLHDPVWYDHLPYIKFPENWPVFSPKDKIGDWLEMYVKVMELNYWSSTTASSAR